MIVDLDFQIKSIAFMIEQYQQLIPKGFSSKKEKREKKWEKRKWAMFFKTLPIYVEL